MLSPQPRAPRTPSAGTSRSAHQRLYLPRGAHRPSFPPSFPPPTMVVAAPSSLPPPSPPARHPRPHSPRPSHSRHRPRLVPATVPTSTLPPSSPPPRRCHSQSLAAAVITPVPSLPLFSLCRRHHFLVSAVIITSAPPRRGHCHCLPICTAIIAVLPPHCHGHLAAIVASAPSPPASLGIATCHP